MTPFQKLKELLFKKLDEAAFDDRDGDMVYCSDSNRIIDVNELALEIIEVLK